MFFAAMDFSFISVFFVANFVGVNLTTRLFRHSGERSRPTQESIF
jgi:hypothetical protein